MSIAIAILAFNRPHLLAALLESLANQEPELDFKEISIWIDGYEGSKDQSLGRANLTASTIKVAQGFVPAKSIFVSDKNLGIARNYHRAELELFKIRKLREAFFFEDDLILGKEYISTVLKINQSNIDVESIAAISATGDTYWETNEEDQFHTSGHAWGYLMRSSFWLQCEPFLTQYISILDHVPYWKRKEIEDELSAYFFTKGIAVAAYSQDAVKEGLRNHLGKISITTGRRYASNLGVVGENFVSGSKHHLTSIDKKKWTNFEELSSVKINEILLNSRRKVNFQLYQNTHLDLYQLRNQSMSLQNENSSLLEENTSLQKENSSLREENTSLQNENSSLREENTSLQNENSSLREEINVVFKSLSWKSTAILRTIKKYTKDFRRKTVQFNRKGKSKNEE